jgi:glyoxylase-like metal-dependent hydrolase (beta-lactamase superfamily II)
VTSASRIAALFVSIVCGLGMHAVAIADSSVTTTRSVTKVADNVYVIRHPDSSLSPQGNTTVIIGRREVLVVDTCYLPSSAREDIEQIRRWTNLPVRYVLNTHWHPDHQRGNAVYTPAFPGVAVIAQHETARLEAQYDGANVERLPRRMAAVRASLASGRGANGKRLSVAEKADMRDLLKGGEAIVEEMRGYTMQYPTLTFDSELNVDLGDLPVQIRHLGAADTLGDAWVYLPNQKILIAGDLLAHPVPYFFSGYPAGVATTLRHLLQIDARAIIPGHGDVQYDTTYMRSVLALVESVIAQVNAEVVREGSLSASLDSVRKVIDLGDYRRQMAGDDAGSQEYFDESAEGLIADAFHQAPK